jgi:hypothetical protein
MGDSESPFKPLPEAAVCSDLQALMARPRAAAAVPPAPCGAVATASTARLHGFDLREAPLLAGLARFPGELVAARTTVALRHDMIGATVLVLHEEGDFTRPIVIGVLQEGSGLCESPALAPTSIDVQADGERLTLSANREIVLRCGDASITLTRAGKVVIQGSYVLSRSTGYNKIKGAAIDIN